MEKTPFELGFEKKAFSKLALQPSDLPAATMPGPIERARGWIKGKINPPVREKGVVAAGGPTVQGQTDAQARAAIKAERASRAMRAVPVGSPTLSSGPLDAAKAKRVAARGAAEAAAAKAATPAAAIANAGKSKSMFQKGFQMARIGVKKNPIAAAALGAGALGFGAAKMMGGSSQPQQQQY